MDGKKIRLLIVEDHPKMREMLVAIFERAGGMEIVGLARDGEEGVRMAEELRPDVITMDVQMPRMGGVEAARKITDMGLGLRVMMCTTHQLPAYNVGYKAAGAMGYAFKGSAQQIVDGVRLVAAGKQSWPNDP